MLVEIGMLVGGVVLGVVLGVVAGARVFLARRFAPTEAERERLGEDARRAAEAIRREAQVEAKEQALRLRAEVEREVGDRRAEAIKAEERIAAKEGEVDGRLAELERR